jgi:amidase
MAADELCYLELTELSERLRTRRVSPVEVTRAILARIEKLDGRLGSFATLTAEPALSEAAQAEAEIARGGWRGPLHGVPIAVKDLCFTKGIPTSAGMPIHAGFRPAFDATVVSRLREAGAVLLGKLQMTEGAFARHHPAIRPPVNPWAADRWTGVSSSGSGVATATGLCFASLGSDTGGSIRFPSAANSVTGVKPTWGRVSRHGIFPLAESLDHIGPMARSAADAAVVLGIIAGTDANDPTSLHAPVPDYLAEIGGGLRGVRIGVDATFNAGGVEHVVVGALDAARAAFASLGADMRSITFPSPDAVIAGWLPLCAVEAALAHETTYPAMAAQYGPNLAAMLDLGHRTTGIEIARIKRDRLAFQGRVAALFRDVDLLLIPALPGVPPTLEEMAATGANPQAAARRLRFTAPFDMTGSPTITLPGGFTATGLPVAVQLVGRHLEESLLLRAGHAFQGATDWHRRRPPI